MTFQTTKSRLPELDGLRGIAILSVVIFHYISQEGATQPGAISAYLQRAVILGWSGVDLFFVLSGFLIGGILMDARDSPSYFKTFYARRFFRIIPIYYLWISTYVVLILAAGLKIRALSHSAEMPPLNAFVFAYYFFLQNLGLPSFGGLAGAWFGHLWSLAIEEQFYLVAPIVVRSISSRKLPYILISVIACVPLMRTLLLLVAHTSPSLVSVLMPCRADALSLGMLAAAFYRNQKALDWTRNHAGAVNSIMWVLFGGVLALWIRSPQSGTSMMQTLGFTWLALFYAAGLLFVLTRRTGKLAKMMRTGWLREFGAVSYCIYIIHIVVNVAMHTLLLHSTPKISTIRGSAVTVCAALVTYAVAKLSMFLVEGPLLKRGHQFQFFRSLE